MGWQDTVTARVKATKIRDRNSMRTPFGPDMRPLQFSCTVQFVKFVNAAAEQVGVNRSTFVRRALAVAAANVLGVSVRTILFESPAPRAWGAHPMPPQQAMGLRDLGEGIEGWCPHPGCTGDHLRSRDSGSGSGLP